MNKHMIKVGLAVLAIGAADSWAKERKMDASDLPEAVQAALKAACPKGTIKKVERERGAFEVEMKVGRMGCDLKIAPDGKVLETETQMKAQKLPEEVKAVLALFDDLEIKKAERVEVGGKVFYELEVEIDEQNFELKIENGKITAIAQENEGGEDDND